jgi:hypothetical protein
VIILQQSTFSVDSVQSDDAIEFEATLDPTVTIPHDIWLWHGWIELVTIVRMNITTDENPSGATKFTNPTRKTHGHAHLLSDGYVLQDETIRYSAQQVFERRDLITIDNCRRDTPLQLARTALAKKSHSFSISESVLCGTAESQVVPSPTPSATLIQMSMPAGAICLSSLPAADHYKQQPKFDEPTANNVVIDRSVQSLATSIKGLLYSGKLLEIVVTSGYRRSSNLAGIPVLPPELAGPSPFPVYSHTCSLGVPVPSPLNPPCVPGLITSYPNPDGSYTFGCEQN